MTTYDLRPPVDAADPPTRRAWAVAVVVALAFTAGAGLVRGEGEKDLKDKAQTRAKAVDTPADADADSGAEAAALAFVRENHTELADLLAQLKPMRPDEYRKAVRELSLVARSLASVKASNPKRYATALAVWKARSRVDLLAARLASAQGPDPELESQLRQAVGALVDAEIAQQRQEKETVEERLRKVRENLERLESRRDSVVDNRVQSLLKKSRRARPRADAKADAQTVRPDDRPAANTNADAERGAGKKSVGERQP